MKRSILKFIGNIILIGAITLNVFSLGELLAILLFYQLLETIKKEQTYEVINQM